MFRRVVDVGNYGGAHDQGLRLLAKTLCIRQNPIIWDTRVFAMLG